MATRLYETLEIQPNASPDDIRRAYKRRALQTHPDRLSQNVSPQEKASAEERFRLVNNAYEVLSDPEKRKVYDRNGVWPPRPSAEQVPRARNGYNDSFSGNDPFFSNPFFGSPFRGFGRQSFFTDPFVLFNTLFGDIQDYPVDNRGRYDRLDRDPFGPLSIGMPFAFGSLPWGGVELHRDGRNSGMRSTVYQSAFASDGQNSRWTSDRQISRTVNGVTQMIHERRDQDGNVHVKVKHPDGRKTYTINGVEQTATGAIADAPRHRPNRNHRKLELDDPPPAYEAESSRSGRRWR